VQGPTSGGIMCIRVNESGSNKDPNFEKGITQIHSERTK